MGRESWVLPGLGTWCLPRNVANDPGDACQDSQASEDLSRRSGRRLTLELAAQDAWPRGPQPSREQTPG